MQLIADEDLTFAFNAELEPLNPFRGDFLDGGGFIPRGVAKDHCGGWNEFALASDPANVRLP